METCGDEAFKTAAESNALPSIALIKSDQRNKENDKIRALSNE